jgi:hypothetical protein
VDEAAKKKTAGALSDMLRDSGSGGQFGNSQKLFRAPPLSICAWTKCFPMVAV